MLIEALRLIVVLAAVVGANRLANARPHLLGDMAPETAVFIITALGAGIGYLAGGALARGVDRLLRGAEEHLGRRHASEVLASTMGLLVGMVLAVLAVGPVLVFVDPVVAVPVAAFAAVVIVAFAVRFATRKRLELFGVLGVMPTPQTTGNGCLLDASATIDGRVLALYRAGLLPQPLFVPSFILWELQGIADSGSPERRRRGQRGLDVLQSLREAGADVRVIDEDPAATTDPDTKLIVVARRRKLPIVTSDSNLAKTASVQGLEVLNLHGLSEMLRSPVLVGGDIVLKIIKPGREAAQGVGYLEDGTMVVVEDAKHLVDQEVDVEVTSIIQTDSGRMLFAKLRSGSELREAT